MPSPLAPDHLPDLQREVQRLMGQNILRLQLYEQQLKRLISATDFGVEIPAAGEPRQTQGIQTGGKTLGQLVGQLLGEVLVSEIPPAAPNRPEAADVAVRINAKLRLRMPPIAHAELQTALPELVDLRNGLVHHFIDGRDFSTLAGCQAAISDLSVTLETVGQRYGQLQDMARLIDGARASAHSMLASPEVHDFLVKGVIPWEFTNIVADLRAAAREPGNGDWTHVNAAAAWIKSRSSDQGPMRYGCTSWRHVIRTSGLFQLRYQKVDGNRIAEYRQRPSSL